MLKLKRSNLILIRVSRLSKQIDIVERDKRAHAAFSNQKSATGTTG